MEFRHLTNGLPTFAGNSLLGALMHFGLDGMDAVEKHDMQDLAIRGAPFTSAERATLLDYCEADVMALRKLLPVMLPRIDLSYAINRGRYMKACARMEHTGIPIDTELLAAFRGNWDQIKAGLIAKVDQGFGVYEGQTFKVARFQKYLAQNGIPWSYLPSGAPDSTTNLQNHGHDLSTTRPTATTATVFVAIEIVQARGWTG